MEEINKVVFLSHIGHLSSEDLEEISNHLKTAKYELKAVNSSGKLTASFQDFDFITYLAISSPLITEFIKGIGTNAGWDVIKETIILVRNKVIEKKYYRITSKTQIEKEITFGFKHKLDKNTSFNFELKGDLSDEIIKESLDKVLEVVKSTKPNNEYKHPMYLKYSKKNKCWVAIDVREGIRKKNKKNKM